MVQSTAKRAGVTLDKRTANYRRSARRTKSQSRGRKLTHLPFAFKIGLAMSMIAVGSALVLVYLAVNQHWRLAQQQADAFGQTIAEQLAVSMVGPVFTDDHLAIQLNLNQLASKTVVNAVAIYNTNGTLLAASGEPVTPQAKEVGAGNNIFAANANVDGSRNGATLDANLRASGAAISSGQQDSTQSGNTQSESGINTGAVTDISAALTGIASSYFVDELKQLSPGSYSAPIIFSGATAGYAVVSIDRTPFSAAFATSSKDLILAVVVISLVSILGAYILSWLLSKPIYRLLAISEAARKGHLPPSLAQKSSMRNEWADIFSIYEQLGQEVKNKRDIEKLLQQFVATDVADQLLDQDAQLNVSGEVVEASVLFVDIVDFTRIAEPMAPKDVASMLNRYLSMFASCARIHQGMVDKFIGDAAMIVFGALRKDENHRLHAMACALAIQSAARQINAKRHAIGLPSVELRIGINAGNMRAGILGSEYRKEFTVVGDSVNLASRLCGIAGAGETVIANSVYEPCRQEVEAVEAGVINVKGKENTVGVFTLKSVKMTKNWVVTNLLEDIVAQH